MSTLATNTEASATDSDQTAELDNAPEQWNHVASLKPQLHKHISAHPHIFRGSRWYILSDAVRGKHLRFNDVAYEFIGRLDGDRTVDEVYQQVQSKLGEDSPSQKELIATLVQLFSIGALKSGIPTDVEQLFARHQAEKSNDRTRRLLNPLAIRFPLFDPDRFLNRTIPFVRKAFTATGIFIWSAVVLFATLLLLVGFQDLVAATRSNILQPGNLILMVVLFPVMKAFHEFAHAFAVKTWGGEVHEMGITLLVLMPVPYVDASAAWAFREKYKRIMVSSAGMIAEIFIAAIALIIWTLVEPGLVKTAALSAFLIGTVSTVLFNANPLLRFDGYYILQDLIEIPNLYSRSSKYLMYLFKSRALGLAAASPVTEESEKPWLAGYGVLAWLYRLFITFVIAIFLASKYFILGVALALWSLTLLFILPLYRGLRFLITDESLKGTRMKPTRRLAGIAAIIVIMITVIPFSIYTRAEGIVWVPDQAQIYSEINGFVIEVSATPGDEIAGGTGVLSLYNPDIDAREKLLKARHKELSIRHKAEEFADPVNAIQTMEEIKTVEADWQQLQSERESQILTTKAEGILVLPGDQRIIGSYIKKGEAVGYVINPKELIVRVVVPQTSVGLFAKGIKEVSVRLAEQPRQVIQAEILRQTPAGSLSLPSRALGAAGGGEIAVDTGDSDGTTAVNKVFQLDLALPENTVASGLGTRAYVRVNHGREALGLQWLRSARQLLLNKLPF